MKKQETMVLFAIALLVGVVALVGSAQAMTVKEYNTSISQISPVDAGKVPFVLSAVDGQWVRGSKCIGLFPMEIIYARKDNWSYKYVIHVYLDEAGYVTNVSFSRWGAGIAAIPTDIAEDSLMKLHTVTPMGRITEELYMEKVNARGPIDLNQIQYAGAAVHREWVKGSSPQASYNMGTGAWETNPATKNAGTLIYYNKWTKWVILLELDGEGKVEFVDFSLNGRRAVDVIPQSVYDESMAKLPLP
jgi:hypothetical protein